jgi:hypothetical protein
LHVEKEKYILKYEENGGNYLYDHDKINEGKINGKGNFAPGPPTTADVWL